ncbi:hypothetical protein EES45_20625 [Streptomyces sp. ADI97-07]|nr:hypothetical protein EES45_20625 [Streptomyces sp. ADI97-07]
MRGERLNGTGRIMLEEVSAPDGGPQRWTGGGPRAEGEEAPASGEARRHFFSRQFPSHARGAQLARRATVRHLDEWGFPSASEVSCTVALVVAELTANAVCHGRVRGRNFLLSVIYDVGAPCVRVEVSDARRELPSVVPSRPADDEESGRGLVLVGALAARWGTHPRIPVGKTVWAECPVAPGPVAART